MYYDNILYITGGGVGYVDQSSSAIAYYAVAVVGSGRQNLENLPTHTLHIFVFKIVKFVGGM